MQNEISFKKTILCFHFILNWFFIGPYCVYHSMKAHNLWDSYKQILKSTFWDQNLVSKSTPKCRTFVKQDFNGYNFENFMKRGF